MCKVTQCPGPRLLFPKVIFNGRNQIGRPVAAYTLTQCMDDLTGLTYVTSVEWPDFYTYLIEKPIVKRN